MARSSLPLPPNLEPLWRCALDWPFLTALVLLVAVSLLFTAMPRIDIAVSALFYDPAQGFLGRGSTLLYLVREAGRLIEWAVALAFVAPPVVKLLAPESRLLVRPRVSLFVLASLALGPGLIVNGILKEAWGRARPRELIEFGGGSSFSQVWSISDQCASNCSFVSGEAASAIWLVALVFVAPKAWRAATLAAALAVALAVSSARLVAGGHFISDVLIAWLLTLLVIVALQKLVLRGLPPAFDRAAEAELTRLGRALRHWWAGFRGPPAV